MRTLAIGDIHGAATALDALLAHVAPIPQDLLVFLGDYVDRGPDSKGVLDRLIALATSGQPMVCLRGNHELMMLRARHDRSELKMWLGVGGTQAIGSYAVNGMRAHLDSVPPIHWAFLEKGCVDYFETDTHIFVHASVDPSRPLDQQTEMMLFWEFVNAPIRHASGKRVICGHSSQRSGLPLSLLELRRGAKIAVVELGMNHSEEIRALVAITDQARRNMKGWSIARHGSI